MICFSNEIGNLCTAIGNVDVVEVMKGVHLDKRLSPITADGQRIVPSFTTYLEAGCGFGGSCFPKDVKALNAYGAKLGSPMQLLESVINVNLKQPERIITLIKQHFPVLKDVRVAVLGLAFKPGTDDIRESPALPVLGTLLQEGASVKAYDPIAQHEAQKLFSEEQLTYCQTLAQAIENVQVVVLITRWLEFQKIPELLADVKEQPLIIDGRRMLDKNSVAHYEGIGLRT
jgi:UDPglucose 6-dehydrogenase/GDP-mannose 6-dehydrogenase